MDTMNDEVLDELKEVTRLLKKEQRSQIPLSNLIEEGRTDDIIERGAQREAKALIMRETDYVKRQRLIIMHMPLFCKERSLHL